jgi:hypothetical protein
MADPELLAADMRSKAGHYEVLGETYAKFEFFEKGWNPYSRFLDVDKVDLILRRRTATRRLYREIQVKFGKLYPVGPEWERRLFDFTSWRFFKEDEFAAQIDQKDFFIAYVLSRDPTPDKPAYQGDIFIFPVREFDRVIRCGIPSKGQRKIYLSRLHGDAERWVLRRATRFDEVTEETCLDVTQYRRNFDALLTASVDLRRTISLEV